MWPLVLPTAYRPYPVVLSTAPSLLRPILALRYVPASLTLIIHRDGPAGRAQTGRRVGAEHLNSSKEGPHLSAKGNIASGTALGPAAYSSRWCVGPLSDDSMVTETGFRPSSAGPSALRTHLLSVTGRYLLRRQPYAGLLRTGRQVATRPSARTEPGN